MSLSWLNLIWSLCTHYYSHSRPQYAVHPTDAGGFKIDDQYYLGSSGLLIKPVTAAGVNEIDVYLADDQVSHSQTVRLLIHAASKTTNTD